MDDWRHHMRVRAGGLLRCCLATLEEHIAAAPAPPQEGDRLQCKHCTNTGGGMVFKRGAWEWAHEGWSDE